MRISDWSSDVCSSDLQGKTHLLHAIGHAYLAAHPRARIFYCSAERFMVEFVQALKANQMIEFKARLRSFDLLLVDDIQRSEEHTSELQSLMRISYAVFCLKKKKITPTTI